MKQFWNERYGNSEFMYGTEPNTFFKETLLNLTPGMLLLPAEGEGRNAVFAACHGWQVDAFDYSEEGKKKADKLALVKGCDLNYLVKDALDFHINPNYYDAIALIYTHFEESMRNELFPKLIASLKPGGILIMEVFNTGQLKYNSGGPKKEALLYTSENIRKHFSTLQISYNEDLLIPLNEGEHHQGEASVIRMIGKKQG